MTRSHQRPSASIKQHKMILISLSCSCFICCVCRHLLFRFFFIFISLYDVRLLTLFVFVRLLSVYLSTKIDEVKCLSALSILNIYSKYKCVLNHTPVRSVEKRKREQNIIIQWICARTFLDAYFGIQVRIAAMYFEKRYYFHLKECSSFFSCSQESFIYWKTVFLI